ncbi:MAG: beta-L-arabinofuranosidase domain-containing protein [Verrucomicrobiia bacterium]
MSFFHRPALSRMLALGILIPLIRTAALGAPQDRAVGANSGARAAITPQAQDFPLSAVTLLESPFRHAMEVNKACLLRLEPDRLLAGFRREAGLSKKAEPYGGWETIPAEGRYSLAGQGLGHYLSALSLMASATGDRECRRRVDSIVEELRVCQEAAGTGILCAFPESRQLFAELAAGQIKSDHLFNLNGGYVPLYVTHKVMAGLRDAWLLLGNRAARDVLVRMADWLETVFAKLNDEQIREMLETEHGGIMEVVADVHSITGESKYLRLAKRLNHKTLFEPMSQGQDRLNGQHANAQIPKAIGMERIYQLTGDPAFGRAARFFWDTVANTRSFVIGGHGEGEFFFDPANFPTQGITSTTGPETCNTYNMLKLSRQQWLVKPSAATADFIERCLFNHILPSQEPDRGGFVYFTSMRPGHYRTYSSDTEDFWCCTDTGMENHSKYGQFIYARSTNRLWVDLLISSTLDWVEQGMRFQLDTRFPEDGKAVLTVSTKEPRQLEIAVRTPGWLAANAMKIAVNGSPEPIRAQPGSYAVIERTWKTGDKIEIEWPLALRTELLPRSREWIAVLWGPIVLAGELGTEGLEGLDFSATHNYVATEKLPLEKVPVFVGDAGDVVRKIKRVEERPLTFQTAGLAKPFDLTLAPFYRVHRQRYAIYWKLIDPGSYRPE